MNAFVVFLQADLTGVSAAFGEDGAMITMKFVVVAAIGFLAMILVVPLALNIGRRGKLSDDSPRPWHPVVRIACGVLAAAIMVAITIATWPATSPMIPADSNPLLLLPPAVEVVAESPADTPAPGSDEKPGRLIYTVLAVAREGDVITPLDGKSVVINLPEDRHRQLVIEGTIPGGSFKSEIVVAGIERVGRNRTWVSGHHEINYETSFGGSGWHGSSLSGDGEVQVDRVTSRDEAAEHRPLSVVPDRVGAITILSQLVECPAEHPGEASGSEWLRANTKEIREAIKEGEFRATWRPQPQPNGIEMIQYVGPASALLLLAAILASQVFRQRGLAFVAAMTFAVLFALVMDRVMVERHAAWLTSHPEDAAGRARVVARMEASYFHAGRVKAMLTAD